MDESGKKEEWQDGGQTLVSQSHESTERTVFFVWQKSKGIHYEMPQLGKSVTVQKRIGQLDC